MQPDERDAALLYDALSAARELLTFTEGVERDQFLRERALQLIAERELTIVGEAVSRLSERFCVLHPDIQWRKIRGLRNIVIHEYGRIDFNIVWDVISVEIPKLIAFILNVLPREPDDRAPE